MEKIRITATEELERVYKSEITEFLKENPIFEKLELTPKQTEVLANEMIYPRIKEKYDFNLALAHKLFKLNV